MKRKKVGIAMSGGVDSTVAASLLLEAGYDVSGFFMLLPLPGLEEHIRRVTDVAGRLGIPLHLVDTRDTFTQLIISYFNRSYRHGKTPNPCVLCNQKIKFGFLMETMLNQQDMDCIATGHYARISAEGNTSFSLHRGVDSSKDQSYFLCRLASEKFSSILFPLGSWYKNEVYKKIQTLSLGDFTAQESQDVCFLPQGLQTFFREQGMKAREGTIININGDILGTHEGICHYTVGQRRGLGLPDATPWYVIGLDGENNQVIVGKNEQLLQTTVAITDLHWCGPPEHLPWQGDVQLRSRHTPAAAQIQQEDSNRWTITFREPQRAITPGQFAVLYNGSQVVASGVICAMPAGKGLSDS